MGLSDIFVVKEGLNEIVFGVVLAIVLILVGFFVGRIVASFLRKFAKKIEVEKNVRPSFVELIITVIKWSIYIMFLDFAFGELPFPIVAEFFSNTLLVIPAFIAALILIIVGFTVAIYLREVVEDSEVTGWRTLSQYLYYFVLYVFGVYAVNLALIPVDEIVRNSITIALTTIIVAAFTYVIVKKEVAKH